MFTSSNSNSLFRQECRMHQVKLLNFQPSSPLPQDLSGSTFSSRSPRSTSYDSDSDEDTYCSGCQSFRSKRHSCTPNLPSDDYENGATPSGGEPSEQKLTENNNIEGYDLEDIERRVEEKKKAFLESLQLQKSPDPKNNILEDEEQDSFIHEYRKMKIRGEFPCRLCRTTFPNLRALKGHNRVHMAYGVLQCNLCPYADSDKNGLLRHMRCHNGDRPYECSLCSFAFTTKANCERHLRNRHSATKSDLRGCIIQREEFMDLPPEDEMEAPLDLSTKKSEPATVETQTIPYIDVKMVVKNGILVPKQKQRRYRTERPFGCEFCSARFTLRSNMERHVKQQHPEYYSRRKSKRARDDRLGGGDESDRKSLSAGSLNGSGTGNSLPPTHPPGVKKREEDLRDLASVSRLLDNARGTFRHYFGDRSEISDEEGLVASGSDNSSDDKSEPETKKKSAYSLAPNRVSCPYCSREFPWSSSLRRHVLTHTGQKPFKCAHCPLLFTTKSNCDRHLLRKHGSGDRAKKVKIETEIEHVIPEVGSEMPFKCHLCESSFSERSDTLDHLKSRHTPEYQSLVSKGALESSCEDEEDETRARVDYANRKVVCAFCLRRFWSAEDLRRHMRTHTGERPFSCSVCARRFTLKHSMLRHRKKHEVTAQRATSEEGTTESDLIGNLLGIQDKELVDSMLEKGAKDAAKILGIENKTQLKI